MVTGRDSNTRREGSIPSQPADGIGCKCRNIFIDVDYARVAVKRDKDIELLEADE